MIFDTPSGYEAVSEALAGAEYSLVRLNPACPPTATAKKKIREMLHSVMDAHDMSSDDIENEDHFKRLYTAIRNDRIQVHFLVAEKEGQSPIFVGGSTQYESSVPMWNGKSFEFNEMIHLEDLAVCPLASQVFRANYVSRTGKKSAGLGTFLMHELARNFAGNPGTNLTYPAACRGMVAEYSRDNTAINRSLGKLNNSFGGMSSGAVMQFSEGLPAGINPKDPNVRVNALLPSMFSSHAEEYPNMFAAIWTDRYNKDQLAATLNLGYSTFLGKPIIRVHIADDGKARSHDRYKKMLMGVLAAGAHEICKNRKWFKNTNAMELFKTVGQHMFVHAPTRRTVHALEEIPGSERRTLGPFDMTPVVIDFTGVPQDLFDFKMPEIKPLAVASPFTTLPNTAWIPPFGKTTIQRNHLVPLANLQRAHAQVGALG